MKVLVVDGNSIINRSYYGVRPLSTKDGTPTNAVFGFLKILNKTVESVSPDCVAVAFDLPAPTFRHIKYPLYKAQRKGMPEELAVQLPIVKRFIELLGYHIVEREGYEADDVLGSFAKMCEENGGECYIATGDRDSLQLIGDNVTVLLSTNRETIIYDEGKIIETYGVKPKELLEVKSLMGDSSDNIPGVKGIGEKTALELIVKYKNIEYIFDNPEKIETKPKIKTLLLDPKSKKDAFLSRELAEIFCDVPIGDALVGDILGNYRTRPRDSAGLQEKLIELEMFSLLSLYGLNPVPVITENAETHKFDVIQNPDIESAKLKLEKRSSLDFITEFDSTVPQVSRLQINAGDIIYDISEDAELAFRQLILENEKPKRTRDVKSLYLHLNKTEADITGVCFDLILAAYLDDPAANNYTAATLVPKYLPNTVFEINRADETENASMEYLEISALPALCGKLEEKLKKQGMSELLCKIELPLSKVLASMEYEGFLLDVQGINRFGKDLESDISVLAEEINELAGQKCNPNSPKELSYTLFEKLGLKHGKKTKMGFSTNAETLEKLKNAHPIVNKILNYRHLAKLNSTYVTGLLKVAGEDGRVRTYFKQTETRTGRISSAEPNLQNIPVRTERGATLREFFIAPEGRVLLDADYSQIELRILAAVSKDGQMISAFNEDDDIHAITASEVFSIPRMILPDELRTRAKAVNFSIVYGISAFSLANDISATINEAKKYIAKYFETYPGVKKYMDNIIIKAKEDGYVSTLFGRRRPLADINSSNHITRTAAERIALNTPIQGTSADIIKIAMIGCYNRLKSENLDAKLILQIHDELIIEASQKDAQRAAEILKEEMENAVELPVKLKADVLSGKSWKQAK